MKLPQLTSPEFTANARFERNVALAGVEPQDCNTLKKIGCAAAVLACGAVCIGSAGAGCAACFASLGMGSCIDCL
jgi:hypothetical protein